MLMDLGSAAPVTFGGLQSGLDTASIIDASVKVAQQPIRNLQRQQAILTAHNETYTRAMERLYDVQSSLSNMSSTAAFAKVVATSSDPGVMKVAAGAGALEGSHRVEIVALARAQRNFSQPVAGAHEAGLLGRGSLDITCGGAAVEPAQPVAPGEFGRTTGAQHLHIDVDENTTLADVADAINDANIEAQASVLFDGQAHRLQVTSSSLGAAHAISFEEQGTTLGLSLPQSLAQSAQDACIVLDGAARVTRTQNTLGDVIPGVSLQLLAAGGPPQVVQVGLDAQAAVQNIEHFVAAYNGLQSYVAELTHYDGVTDHAKSVGDHTLHSLQRHMQAAIGQPIAAGPSQLRSLAQIGLTHQKNGNLSIDMPKLVAATSHAPQQVARLFVPQQNSGGQSVGVAAKLAHIVDRFCARGSGSLAVGIDSAGQRIKSLQQQIDRTQTHVNRYEALLRDRYIRLEKTMAQIKSQNHYLDALKPQPQRR